MKNFETRSLVSAEAESRPSVLILEDEQIIAMDMQMILQQSNIKANTARNVSEALSHCDKTRVSGAILDINLSGSETSEPFADMLRDNDIPFAFCSGNKALGTELAQKFGVTFIEKPVTPSQLTETVQGLLDQH